MKSDARKERPKDHFNQIKFTIGEISLLFVKLADEDNFKEAIDVNDYCREFLRRSKISDNIRILKEDKVAFSGFTLMVTDILEHCWNDWK